MASINKSKANLKLGLLGEDLVALWLEGRGFKILARRWHCYRGEIDIIALLAAQNHQNLDKLAFVEVKTRSHDNWDAGGLLAIAPAKQAKIKTTAALFLAENPDLADSACQFDVALVSHRQGDRTVAHLHTIEANRVALNEPLFLGNSTLCLENYLEAAFE